MIDKQNTNLIKNWINTSAAERVRLSCFKYGNSRVANVYTHVVISLIR